MDERISRTCRKCGAEYTQSRRAKRCNGMCPECQRTYYREYRRNYEAQQKALWDPEEEKRNPAPGKSLAEVSREANAMGMTYGEYMTYLKNQAT